MKFQQLRNATIIIEYAGKKFLVDPMLAEKGAFPGFEGTPNSHIANPLVHLPIPMDEILDVDAVIVTHIHPDHWDEAAIKLVPKDMLIFAQNENDAAQIKEQGFKNVRALEEKTVFEDITLIKTPGRHGGEKTVEKYADLLGLVSGVIFKHPNEKTVYIAGDTVWYEGVEENLKKYEPDVVILNSGDAQVLGYEPIIMDKKDVYEVYKAAPKATIIASHMESVNHAMLSRKELREFLSEKGMTQRVLVPEDGETCVF
jgi:L-ascorbate metabolism protein UlaG (beta-lactamase superfamily)